jgi:hypothetical protein
MLELADGLYICGLKQLGATSVVGRLDTCDLRSVQYVSYFRVITCVV